MQREPLRQFEVAKATRRFKVDAENPIASVPDSIWNDPNINVELKCDGHRFKCHVFADINRFDSRRESVETKLYAEKTDHAPHLRDYLMPDLVGTVFDGELVAGKDSNSVAHALGSHATDDEKRSICYNVFDILMFRGKDVRSMADRVRRALLEKLFAETSVGKCSNIMLIPRVQLTPDQKKQVLVDVLAAGQEGIMLKDASKAYGQGWTKVKREARYDVVVMGYDDPKPTSIKKGDAEATETKFAANGWIGAIVFGQWVGDRLVEFGRTSGMDEAVRQFVSENKQACLGRPFEIAAQERFPKTGKFRHPRFIRWRDEDKNASECIYREDEV